MRVSASYEQTDKTLENIDQPEGDALASHQDSARHERAQGPFSWAFSQVPIYGLSNT